MTITMEPVDSTLIAAIGRDEETQTTRIEFVSNGAVWDYSPVPPADHQALRMAPSTGSYFLRVFKPRFGAMGVQAG